MMAAHGIPVSAQEMIICWRKDRFIAEIVPNVPPETRRRPPVAAATWLPDICQISPALILRPLLFHKLEAAVESAAAWCCCSCCMHQQHAAAACNSSMEQHHPAAAYSSTMQQHHAAAGPSSFHYTYTC